MGLRQALVERERPPGLGPGALEPLLHRRAAVVELQRVGVGQAGVGQRVVRVLRDGRLEVPDPFGDGRLACAGSRQ